MQPVRVIDCWKLQLHIYVLGCYPEGESILIVLFDTTTQESLKSILVDCYETNGQNKLEAIFQKYGINKRKLDYVIWTHPDRDHSVGFSKIASLYSSNKTRYLLPDGLSFWEVFTDWDKLKSWASIAWNKKIGKNNVERVNASNLRRSPVAYDSVFFDGINDDVTFSIEILTPFANQAFRHLEFNKTHKGNHMSISFVLRLGDLGFYFGGDTENMAIKMIDINMLKGLFFVKIPHHGSDTSDKLPEILKGIDVDDNRDVLAVTTGYHIGKSNLPLSDVLDKYKTCSWKILKTEDDSHSRQYGIWGCILDRTSKSLWSLNNDGDAEVYY